VELGGKVSYHTCALGQVAARHRARIYNFVWQGDGIAAAAVAAAAHEVNTTDNLTSGNLDDVT